MQPRLPPSWKAVLADEFTKPYFPRLQEFVAAERETHTVYPPEADVYNAFKYTPYDEVKVLLLGQDPYHGANQAEGLCFSVRTGVPKPPSLVNIYKEMEADLGVPRAAHGFLEHWARQGVLLLNTVLTVQMGLAASHRDKGWERFTDAVVRLVAARDQPVVFMLWGSHAQKKAAFVDSTRHLVLRSPHPSPLSAHTGFFGSKPFSKANAFLVAHGEEPIDWALPPL